MTFGAELTMAKLLCLGIASVQVHSMPDLGQIKVQSALHPSLNPVTWVLPCFVAQQLGPCQGCMPDLTLPFPALGT